MQNKTIAVHNNEDRSDKIFKNVTQAEDKLSSTY